MLTEGEKVFAIVKLKEGWSLKCVADEQVALKPLISTKRKWEDIHDLSRRPSTGVALKTSQADDERLMQFISDHPFALQKKETFQQQWERQGES